MIDASMAKSEGEKSSQRGAQIRIADRERPDADPGIAPGILQIARAGSGCNAMQCKALFECTLKNQLALDYRLWRFPLFKRKPPQTAPTRPRGAQAARRWRQGG